MGRETMENLRVNKLPVCHDSQNNCLETICGRKVRFVSFSFVITVLICHLFS
jgi:hypothetical protein